MEKFYEKKNFGIPAVILCVIAYLTGYLLTFNLEGGLLVAILFAAIVFGFQYDDKVKSAVKQSYITAILVRVIYLGFDLLEDFIGLISPQEFSISSAFGNKLEDISDLYDLNAFHEVLLYIDRYGKAIFGILVTVAFFIFIIQALRNKEVKFQFVSNMLGEGIPKKAPVYQPQAYQQPVAPVQQPAAPVQQPAAPVQQPAAPVQQPVAPVQQPVAPVQQPAAPVQQPVAPVQQPVAPVQPAPQAPVQPAVNPGLACPNCGKVNQPNAGFCAGCGTKLK